MNLKEINIFLIISILFIFAFFQIQITGKTVKPIELDISQDSSIIFEEAKLTSDKDWLWCTEEVIDDEKNYGVYGTIVAKYKYKNNWWDFLTKYKTETYGDYCLDEDTLREHFCAGKKPYYIDYKCENGCDSEAKSCKNANECTKAGYNCIERRYPNKPILYSCYEQNKIPVFDYLSEEPRNLDCGSEKVVCCSETTTECIDSDGRDYYIKGETISEESINANENKPEVVVRNDECSDENHLKELSCKNNIHIWNNIRCLYGCESGACVKEEIEIPKEPSVDPSCKLVYKGGDGDPRNNLDLVFVGNGFSNLNEFISNIEGQAGGILDEPTIRAYKNRINIWRVDELRDLDCHMAKKELEEAPECKMDNIKLLANKCPGDFAYVIWDYNFPDKSVGSVVFDYENPIKRVLIGEEGLFTKILPIYNNKKLEFIGSAVSTSYDDGTIVTHELGHLIAELPDYYREDYQCTNHPCIMCNQDNYPFFSSEKLCIDKQRMVEQLNQFCDAEITYISNTYPNPWDGSGVVKVDYRVEYPTNADPCYILMHIYSASNKQEVRVLVTDKPMNANCPTTTSRHPSIPQTFSISGKTCEYYTFMWDGKDNEGRKVASGIYFYKITGNIYSFKTTKGTIVK